MGINNVYMHNNAQILLKCAKIDSLRKIKVKDKSHLFLMKIDLLTLFFFNLAAILVLFEWL